MKENLKKKENILDKIKSRRRRRDGLEPFDSTPERRYPRNIGRDRLLAQPDHSFVQSIHIFGQEKSKLLD